MPGALSCRCSFPDAQWELSGDRLVEVLATLASPHRLRVLAAPTGGRAYVSQLARDLGISRALLQVHLKKLEKAGLVTAPLELSAAIWYAAVRKQATVSGELQRQ